MRGKPPNSPDSVIVDPAILAAVQEDLLDHPLEVGEQVLAAEPALSKFVSERELQLFGRMALAGARPDFIRAVANELHDLLAVVVRSFHVGYLGLLDPFMPADEPSFPESTNSGTGGNAVPPPPDPGDANIPF